MPINLTHKVFFKCRAINVFKGAAKPVQGAAYSISTLVSLIGLVLIYNP